MKEANAKKRTGVRRAALALLAALLLSLAPVSQPTEAAGATSGTVEMVRWTRVRTMNDLPTDDQWRYLMVAFFEPDADGDATRGLGHMKKDGDDRMFAEAANTISYFPFAKFWDFNGGQKEAHTDFDFFDTFGPNLKIIDGDQQTKKLVGRDVSTTNGVVVQGDYLPALIKYVGVDEEHYTTDFFGIDGVGDENNKNFMFNIRVAQYRTGGTGWEEAWYVGLGEKGGSFSFTDDGYAGVPWDFEWDSDHQYGPEIFHYDTSSNSENEYWNGKDEVLQLNNDDDYDDNQYAIWIGDPVYYAAITTDYTVRSGEVLNIDGETILMDGVTLTIEPGAVLSVQGTFINNGTILNCGTVYLREEACMMPLDSAKASAGKIICVGGERYGFCAEVGKNGEYRQCCGDLILNHNARLMMQYWGRLYLQDGATLVNNGGIVMTDTAPLINSSTILNREGGQFLLYAKVQNMDRFFLPVAKHSTQTGVDGLKSLNNVTVESSSSNSAYMSIENSLIVNEGDMFSWWCGVTGLVTTRGKGRTFSDQDKDITTASSTNYSTDH